MGLCISAWVLSCGRSQVKIFITYQKYAGEILKAFGMCKVVGTPMEVDIMKLSMEDSSPLVEEGKYRKLVGSLIYYARHDQTSALRLGYLVGFPTSPRRTIGM